MNNNNANLFILNIFFLSLVFLAFFASVSLYEFLMVSYSWCSPWKIFPFKIAKPKKRRDMIHLNVFFALFAKTSMRTSYFFPFNRRALLLLFPFVVTQSLGNPHTLIYLRVIEMESKPKITVPRTAAKKNACVFISPCGVRVCLLRVHNTHIHIVEYIFTLGFGFYWFLHNSIEAEMCCDEPKIVSFLSFIFQPAL